MKLRTCFFNLLALLFALHIHAGCNTTSQYASLTPSQVFQEFHNLVVSGEISKARKLTAKPLKKYWEEDSLSMRHAPFNLTFVDATQSGDNAELKVEGIVYRVWYPLENGAIACTSVDRTAEGTKNDPRNRDGAGMSEAIVQGVIKLRCEKDGWKIFALKWSLKEFENMTYMSINWPGERGKFHKQ